MTVVTHEIAIQPGVEYEALPLYDHHAYGMLRLAFTGAPVAVRAPEGLLIARITEKGDTISGPRGSGPLGEYPGSFVVARAVRVGIALPNDYQQHGLAMAELETRLPNGSTPPRPIYVGVGKNALSDLLVVRSGAVDQIRRDHSWLDLRPYYN